MALSGNLKTMELPDLLQWLTLGRKTGALAFIKNRTKNYIYFKQGRIISSSSNDPTKYLGQFLLFQGKITESQLKRALEIKQQGRLNLGKVLVQGGFLSQEEIERTLLSRTEEALFDLFLWEDGFFHFADDPYDENELVVIAIDLNGVIFEGVRRKDEWARIREAFPSNNLVFGLRPTADLKNAAVTPLQKKLLFFVSLGKTVAEMIMELHGSDFLVNFELYQLYEKDIVEIKEVREAEEEPEEPATLLTRGLDLMQQAKHAEALAVFQEILAVEPNNFRVHELVEQAENALCQEFYRNALAPSRIPCFLVPDSALGRYNLNSAESFVASRVNGAWDVKSIVALSPLREIDILQTLDKFLKLKLVELR